jgi:hypothetical protein
MLNCRRRLRDGEDYLCALLAVSRNANVVMPECYGDFSPALTKLSWDPPQGCGRRKYDMRPRIACFPEVHSQVCCLGACDVDIDAKSGVI